MGLAVLLVATAGVVGFLLDDVLVDDGAESADPPNQTTDPTTDPPPAGVPDDAEPAIVEAIVDGDTVRVIAAPGGAIPEGGSIRIRLLNVDAPELGGDGQAPTCGAVEAADHLASMIEPGELVWLAADREDRDRFDRPLRGMWTDDGRFVNERLAEAGDVEVVLYPPNDRFHARIAAAVDRARDAGRGIWGERCAA